ncbi:MAG TPA: glycosyltransferase family 39 protein [Gammaproteobacteria bacterium]|nr:glycosyltransferase family 39 protein [Gammaproteobacteria bacterium]
MHRSCSEFLWGKNAKFTYLFIAAAILLLTCLGSREIWTQEHRWSDIVYAMLYHHDYLHPTLNGHDYYDKPLLSYWLIVFLAKLSGGLTTWAMRLPSALAGLLAIGSIYSLGAHLKDRRLGLLAGWMLLTTFYFIFWARTSSADMLNLAGTLFAVAWYSIKKSHISFFNYAIFFLILALTALCKGLVAPVVACLVILPDLFINQTWKKHLRLSLVFAWIPAAIVYMLPFFASVHFNGSQYGENGLMLVYRENILRYFQPFDHKDPIYSYLIYLPLYLLPWTVFFLPALFSLKSRWKKMSSQSRWMVWSVVLLFLFFTLSGSRRNYYILPVVPFAILLTADWILVGAETLSRNVWAGRTAIVFFVLFFISFDAGQKIYYSGGGMNVFAETLQKRINLIKPWEQWNIVMLDAESKIRFYLDLSPDAKNYGMDSDMRDQQTQESLSKRWPFLRDANKKRDTIFISRKQYEKQLQGILTNYNVIEAKPIYGERLFHDDAGLAIAFVPN